MKIQLLSDLHNEFLRNVEVPADHLWTGSIPETDADIIVLAGDIDVGPRGVAWAIEESARLSKPVIYVFGNHEFYHHEYPSLKTELFQLCDGTDVHCLDCGEYISADVRFIGATLWTDYQVDSRLPQDLAMYYAGKGVTDHKVISFKSDDDSRIFIPEDALSIHQKELAWIKKQLAKPFAGKTVMVTHHGPHPSCRHPDYPLSEINSAFYSDLRRVIENHHIDLWLYGHTHANLDLTVSSTRILSNQAGYPGEYVEGFNAGIVVEA